MDCLHAARQIGYRMAASIFSDTYSIILLVFSPLFLSGKNKDGPRTANQKTKGRYKSGGIGGARINDPRGIKGDESCSVSVKHKAVTGQVGEPIFPVLISKETKSNTQREGHTPL
jgi:hypothetical protein